MKVVLWPGMQMQRLTTNEPDDEMLECAIAAMQRVLEREEREESGAGLGVFFGNRRRQGGRLAFDERYWSDAQSLARTCVLSEPLLLRRSRRPSRAV